MVKIDEVGPWSRKKLDLLRNYLIAYTKIMTSEKIKSWCKSRHYVDAFAGATYHVDKESYELIEGSPRIALNLEPGFDTYSFIDMDRRRIKDTIDPLCDEYPEKSKNIFTHCGDCNQILTEKILPQFPNKGFCPQRGFMFLDPYGINLNWSTVEAVANSGIFDVLINFSVMGVYRKLGDKLPCDCDRQKINALMGTEDWLKVAYAENKQMSLLDLPELNKFERRRHEIAERLVTFYQERLQTCFKHVSRAVIMKNSSGGPMYALILASHAELAKKKMEEIFARDKKRPNINVTYG